MALITAMIFYTKSQESLLSVSVRRVDAVLSTGFKGGGKPCPKTREILMPMVVGKLLRRSNEALSRYLHYLWCLENVIFRKVDRFSSTKENPWQSKNTYDFISANIFLLSQ